MRDDVDSQKCHVISWVFQQNFGQTVARLVQLCLLETKDTEIPEAREVAVTSAQLSASPTNLSVLSVVLTVKDSINALHVMLLFCFNLERERT